MKSGTSGGAAPRQAGTAPEMRAGRDTGAADVGGHSAYSESQRGGGRFALYHPTSGGSGSALRLEPRLEGDRSGRIRCFFLEMAAQKTLAGSEGGRRVAATFDWEHKLIVKLDMPDLCELLAVLKGHVDKVGGTRHGLYHDNGRGSTVISLQRNAEKGGFSFGLSRKENGAEQVVRHHMALSVAEGLGLSVILEAGIERLVFSSGGVSPVAGDAGVELGRELT